MLCEIYLQRQSTAAVMTHLHNIISECLKASSFVFAAGDGGSFVLLSLAAVQEVKPGALKSGG